MEWNAIVRILIVFTMMFLIDGKSLFHSLYLFDFFSCETK